MVRMAVSDGPRFGLTRWSDPTDPFGRTQLDGDHEALEAKAVGYLRNTLANRPAAAPANIGFLYEATDEAGRLYWSTGTAWIEVAPPAVASQTFTASGTWTKPAGLSAVWVHVIGGGGGANEQSGGTYGGGGGGGAGMTLWIPASSLPATVPVVVGAGGTSGTSGAPGTGGGTSSFGDVTADGGLYGTNGGAGGDAMRDLRDTSLSPGQGMNDDDNTSNVATTMFRGGSISATGRNAIHGGGGGGGGNGDGTGGRSIYGGGGGGKSGLAPGTSILAGDGNGGVPGGGGRGGTAGGLGNGGRGEVRVLEYF